MGYRCKWIQHFKVLIWISIGTVLLINCQSTPVPRAPLNPDLFEVSPADDWSLMLVRDSGWFAADGIFSISLDGNDHNCDPNKEIMFWFSDTYVGKVVNNVPDSGSLMVNNSIAYLKGCDPISERIEFGINHDAIGRPRAYFVPDNSQALPGQYYWLGDGFVNQEQEGKLYLFAYHIEMTGPDVFDFAERAVSIIAIPKGDKAPFLNARQIPTPFFLDHPEYGIGSMGAGVLVNTTWAGATSPDGYIYVYGSIGADKNLLTARTMPKEFEAFDQWEYWTGEDWSHDPAKAKATTNAVSNELSVTAMPSGEFLLTFQVMGLSEWVGCRIGNTPIGPWSDIIYLYKTPESDQGMFTYNAKAHPALSKQGELIISYNTITLDFWNDIKAAAHIYRPRFIRLRYEHLKAK